ncbi:DUF916 and DUF3324 domain-containing protein [Loigolactobacillus zhaoyuanensis]|uniref:DUF916 and DUF3324 domain-containing protein n=1 Tax=Loigolactobacillus zhaoyuanensis TaxID=2486017 RepID=A0ABW8U9N3_9LACO|nr:DUF916 and DUF3324 domain-containing protein [Loigolactobacillus zhaoyuanensis]
MKKQHLLMSLVMLVGGLFLSIGGHADSAQAASGDGAGFTVKAVLPDNQANKSVSYFDLNVEPGKTQELQVEVNNLEQKAKTLKVQPNTAFTNSNGVIEYSKAKLKKDSSAKYTFRELMSKTQTVKLAAGEKKTLTFELKVPKNGFRGSMLGGFYVTPVEEKSAAEESSGGMQINNKFAMLVGVHLHGKGTAMPDLKLNKVKPTLQNKQPVVLANLQNTEPVAFGGMTVDAKVTKKGDSKVLYERKKDKMQMAPNSNFNYAINIDEQGFKTGTYTLKMTAKAAGKTWNFTRDFKVTRQTTKLNGLAAGVVQPDYTWAYVAGGVALIVIIAGLAFYLGKRKNKSA